MNKKLFVICVALCVFITSCSKNNVEEQLSSSDIETSSEVTTTVANPTDVLIANGNVEFMYLDSEHIYLGEENVGLLDSSGYELHYNYQPADVYIAEEVWTSSDENVATVDENGVVKPVGIGECEITLTVTDGFTEGATTTTSITVNEMAFPDGLNDYELLASRVEELGFINEETFDYGINSYSIDGRDFVASLHRLSYEYDFGIMNIVYGYAYPPEENVDDFFNMYDDARKVEGVNDFGFDYVICYSSHAYFINYSFASLDINIWIDSYYDITREEVELINNLVECTGLENPSVHWDILSEYYD